MRHFDTEIGHLFGHGNLGLIKHDHYILFIFQISYGNAVEWEDVVICSNTLKYEIISS
jgi:hypothetical protein